MNLNQSKLTIIDLGLKDYNEAWDIQKSIHEKVSNLNYGPVALLVEHPSVLTLGKHANRSFIYASEAELAQKKIKIVEIDRGGEVTAHVPGQLVVYPILHLPSYKFGAKDFINALEASIIDLLKFYGVEAARHNEHPGVWVGSNKIAAVGVRVKNRTTLHGFSININNEFDLFQQILPCGIRGHGVTSLEKELKKLVDFSGVKKMIEKTLTNCLHIGEYQSTHYNEFLKSACDEQ